MKEKDHFAFEQFFFFVWRSFECIIDHVNWRINSIRKRVRTWNIIDKWETIESPMTRSMTTPERKKTNHAFYTVIDLIHTYKHTHERVLKSCPITCSECTATPRSIWISTEFFYSLWRLNAQLASDTVR